LNRNSCQPVWSFDRPSRLDGFIVWFAMRTYWLVTVSGFQGSSCGGFPAFPAVLPTACQPNRVRRQGDTLRTRTSRVNRFLEVFRGLLGTRCLTPFRARKTPSGTFRKARNLSTALRPRSSYGLVSRRSSVFNTRSSLPEQPWCGGVMYQPEPRHARGSSNAMRMYPGTGDSSTPQARVLCCAAAFRTSTNACR
jgi:hypothetical protein